MKRLLFVLSSALLLSACAPRELIKDEIALDRYKEANAAFVKEQYQECIPHYEYVIQWRDRIFDAYVKLGICYEQVGRGEESVTILKTLLRVDPTNIEGMRTLAHVYERSNDQQSAIDLQQKLLDRNPGDKQAWNDLQRLRGESGE
ncbi:MAG: hypothetical protein QF645_02210 [Planctomycetota bacterium]|jgi:tetratricopeptide (TPR) repeat protein|nr:hypothetical protein [Planctomycetota bacterium]